MTPSDRAIRAQPPKQQRGQVRVAAIMETGAALFKEKGYDAATMSEIAARSGTSIGSLYRFFPSKEVLADALLLQYAQHVLGVLAALERQAAELPLQGLADAFVDFMLTIQSDRSFAIALIDARGGTGERRAQFRGALCQGIAAILLKALPHLSQTKSEIVATTVLRVLKSVAAGADELPAKRQLLLAEIRALMRAYFASLHHPL